ncbi:MAG: ATP-binding protein [Bdellovibrionaceae bacterium]|nr:ATP-binding protein [Pseudobdellovibrionaceae bacterium]
MNIDRYLHSQIRDDLTEKMVFIGGPRQVGKTTLAKAFIQKPEQYMNWDLGTDKRLILTNQINPKLGLIVLDEIHKFKKWRGLLKGYYDKYSPDLNFIVTGSARLDHFRKGGDSLVGRYHYLRLHPLSLGEIGRSATQSDFETLLTFGGFPEPFLKQSTTHLNRWQRERVGRVITQDLRDLETVKDVSMIELLAESLKERVASPLSIKSLQEDLEVSPNTVDRWIQILESLYYCYRISPYGPTKIKAVKKTRKLYLWDWSELDDAGARFENFVASHLLKFCHHQEDALGLKTELRYFKDVVTGREIDFIVLQKNKPLFAVECKSGDRELSKSLSLLGRKLKIPRLYQVHRGKKDYGLESEGRVLPFTTFCRELGLP